MCGIDQVLYLGCFGLETCNDHNRYHTDGEKAMTAEIVAVCA